MEERRRDRGVGDDKLDVGAKVQDGRSRIDHSPPTSLHCLSASVLFSEAYLDTITELRLKELLGRTQSRLYQPSQFCKDFGRTKMKVRL